MPLPIPSADIPDESGPAKPLVLWVLRFAALVAAAASGYLAWIALSADGAVGCGAMGMDCENVLASHWARWLGVPVGLPAASLYLTLLFTLAFAGRLAPPSVRRLAWFLSTWLIYIAAAAGAWFASLQWLAVDGFCPWCMTVHTCAWGMAVLALAAGREAPSRKLLAAGVGLAGAGSFVAGQVLLPEPEPRMAVERIVHADGAPPVQLQVRPPVRPDFADENRPALGASMDDLVLDYEAPREPLKPPAETNSASAYPADWLQEDAAESAVHPATIDSPAVVQPSTSAGEGAPRRMISLLGGKAEVDAYQHPILGSPQAQHVVVKLYDYTCGHCREMHGHLSAARERFGDELAVLLLPAPMNPDCNPHVVHRNYRQAEACQLAALALAVWQADAAKFPEFDHWLFEPHHPPTAAQARAKAESLVGPENLARELEDWRLSQRMAAGVELYKLSEAGVIPKIFLPRAVLRGRPGNREEVILLLLQELGLRGEGAGER